MNADILFKTYLEIFPNSARAEEIDYMRAYTFYMQSPKPELDQTNTIKAMNMMQIFINRKLRKRFIQSLVLISVFMCISLICRVVELVASIVPWPDVNHLFRLISAVADIITSAFIITVSEIIDSAASLVNKSLLSIVLCWNTNNWYHTSDQMAEGNEGYGWSCQSDWYIITK